MSEDCAQDPHRATNKLPQIGDRHLPQPGLPGKEQNLPTTTNCQTEDGWKGTAFLWETWLL